MLVPVEQCVYVLENNIENTFRFYLLLKLMYQCGKAKFTKEEINFLTFVLNVHPKTIKTYINRLVKLKWIRLNTKTGYYIIFSFDKLRKFFNWESRASIEMYFADINKIQAVLGATIYTYLHKGFWRKVKREKSVIIKGYTYHFLSPSFNYKNHYAPISLNGIKKIFKLSQAKASRIKTKAYKEGLINVKKQYRKLGLPGALVQYLKKDASTSKNIIFKNGEYYIQLIDLVLPNISIRKRKKLET